MLVLPAFDEHGQHADSIADWSAAVDDPSVQSELRTGLTAALDELPPEYRAVVVLRDVEGLSHRDIGEGLAGYMAPGSAVRSIGILPEGIATTTSTAG